MINRITLEKATNINSSYVYSFGWKKGRVVDVSKFGKGAYICPDMLAGLHALDVVVKQHEGTLKITDLFRSWEDQDEARKEYESGIKKDFVALPGGSFHNAGRAVDFFMNGLDFKNTDKEHWVQKFWDLARPLGFHPIIKIPDLHTSEVWHFDYPGDWENAYKILSYGEVAKCCILDIGQWKKGTEEEKIKMFIQAQLIRLGYFEVGKVDGIIGRKTQKVLTQMNFGDIPFEEIADVLKII